MTSKLSFEAKTAEEYVIFVGNPGTGKSTLLNCLIGKNVFKSGFNLTTGITRTLQLYKHEGVIYGDTPGLSDINIRKQAGIEIAEALKKNGFYKLVFFLTLEAGRIRPSDLCTIEIVLDSIKDNTLTYAIVVNKASKRIIQELNNEIKLKEFIACLNFNHLPTINIFLYPNNEDLEDQDNVFVKVNPEFESFLRKLPYKYIASNKIIPIKGEKFVDLEEFYELKLIALKKDFQLQEKELQKQIESLSKSVNKLQLENEQQKEQRSEEQRKNYEQERKINRVTAGIFTLGLSEVIRTMMSK